MNLDQKRRAGYGLEGCTFPMFLIAWRLYRARVTERPGVLSCLARLLWRPACHTDQHYTPLSRLNQETYTGSGRQEEYVSILCTTEHIQYMRRGGHAEFSDVPQPLPSWPGSRWRVVFRTGGHIASSGCTIKVQS